MRASKRGEAARSNIMRAARKEHARGRKLLALRANDAAQLHPVRIYDAELARHFERCYPGIERCVRLLERTDCTKLLGKAAAEKLAARLRAMIAEVVAERTRELEAASAYVADVAAKLGERFIRPTRDRPAFDGPVRARGASAEGALSIFLLSDRLFSELEALYWNGLRSISERDEARLRAKRLVRPIFIFAEATSRNILRRLAAHSADGKARSPRTSRPDLGGAPDEHTKAQARAS